MTDSPRPTFNEAFNNLCRNWTETLLTELPELKAVAIVPLWEAGNDSRELPAAFIRGRHGPLTGIEETLGMLQRLVFAQQLQARELMEAYRRFDQLSQQLAEQIHEQNRTLKPAHTAGQTRPDAG